MSRQIQGEEGEEPGKEQVGLLVQQAEDFPIGMIGMVGGGDSLQSLTILLTVAAPNRARGLRTSDFLGKAKIKQQKYPFTIGDLSIHLFRSRPVCKGYRFFSFKLA